MKIITSHVFPPIPDRQFDWCAHRDGDEEISSLYGWGPTKEAAIADLMELLADWELDGQTGEDPQDEPQDDLNAGLGNYAYNGNEVKF